MTVLELFVAAGACAVIGNPIVPCVQQTFADPQSPQDPVPHMTGEALDVVLTAEAAYAWDIATGTVLYDKQSTQQRPVASLIKLASALYIRHVPLAAVVEIPQEVRKSQTKGADVRLPPGHHASVTDLLEASMVASANDAMTALAVAASQTEEKFAEEATRYIATLGISDTRLANATGLSDNGAEQHSTAYDVSQLLTRAYNDAVLRPMLSRVGGTLTTEEGFTASYDTTNDLVHTYVPVLVGKTGFTTEAGENVAVITKVDGHTVGTVILGSRQRFQDTKILVEYIHRNYTW